jgi:hypothetical protein
MAKKIFVMIAALIVGGLGIAVVSIAPHAAQAGTNLN